MGCKDKTVPCVPWSSNIYRLKWLKAILSTKDCDPKAELLNPMYAYIFSFAVYFGST